MNLPVAVPSTVESITVTGSCVWPDFTSCTDINPSSSNTTEDEGDKQMDTTCGDK